MKTIIYPFVIFTALLLLFQSPSVAQNSTMDDVRLFQSFFRDAPIASDPYVEGLGTYSNVELGSTVRAGIQGGYGLTPDIEITTGVYYLNFNFDGFANEAGLADIPVYARYSFTDEETKISGGAYATIPVGDEIIGQENLDFGFFGAIRHPASDEVVVTGTLGVDFLDTSLEREASLNLGAGVIYAATQDLSVVSELRIQSDLDYSALSGGVDYKLKDLARLRANLLLGVDDGAPDYGLTGGILVIIN